MTKAEVAQYLRCSDDTVDRRSVPWAKVRTVGCIRRMPLPWERGDVKLVRFLRADVMAILPDVAVDDQGRVVESQLVEVG